MDLELFRRVAKALADPRRRAQFERIARDPEVACMTLVEGCDITQALNSLHMKELDRRVPIAGARPTVEK